MNNHLHKLISVVIPVYHEEKIVDEMVRRLTQALKPVLSRYNYELIFINDGSTDASLSLLVAHAKQDSRIVILDLSRNFGHQFAISAGLDYASGDAVVVIDGDLQDPPEIILDMIKKWEGGVHVAYGQRLHRTGEGLFKRLTAKLFYRVLKGLADVDIPVDTGDFRLMDRKVVDQLKKLPERNRYIRGLVKWVGFSHEAVFYERDPRHEGKTKYTFNKMLKFALDGLTGFSNRPLYLAAYVGILFAVLSILSAAWVVYGYLTNKAGLVTGWASMMTIMFVLGSVQLISLSISGQYIARIYTECRERPLYIIKDVVNFKDTPPTP
ncbi:MAG: glycosyltransferase family 2 protein [Deltaproteobacteria bacterium]|nr:glycosyltransferase family 2 protein [Deltaproteobacteria bacterium]